MNSISSNAIRTKSYRLQKNHQLIRAFLKKLIQPRKTMLIYCHANFKNPYQMLMYGFFENTNILPVSLDQIRKAKKTGLADLLHIHWDEFFFRSKDPEQAALAREIVLDYKSGGGGVVWTVHNEAPHEIGGGNEDQEFERNRHFICEHADLIHAHSDYSKKHIVNRYSVAPEKIVVIPHPSYLGWYNTQYNPKWKEYPAFLFFGNLKSYKGFDVVLNAFNNIAHPERVAGLIIAGRGGIDFGEELANGIRVFHFGRYIDDEDVPSIFDRAQFAVFGFSRILTSGSLMLALTFGVPPIAPAHESIKSWLPVGLHDLLYTPGDSQDFARVLDYASSLSEEKYCQKQRLSYSYAKEVAPERISVLLERELARHFR